MKKSGWVIAGVYGVVIISFIIYSYSHIDLNLTLSSNPLYQSIQQQLVQLGYFNRPLSAALFLLLLTGFFGLYFLVIWLIKREKMGSSDVWKLVGITLILMVAYPAFSHDIFNYMFDARIVTQYGLDPRFFKALDFAGDPWTRFMRWTHRYYPYGPGWILLTLIPSYLGMGKFVITLFLFKLMFVIFHFFNSKLIEKILSKISPANVSLGLAFFALNPLVLTESLVSPHNEVMMFTFALAAIYFLLSKRIVASVVFSFVSIGIKFISFVLLPLMILIDIKKRPSTFFTALFLAWLVMLVPVIHTREPFSWYFVPVLGLAALRVSARWISSVAVGLSAATMIRYWPFILIGDYGIKTQTFQWWGMWMVFLLSAVGYWLWQRRSTR